MFYLTGLSIKLTFRKEASKLGKVRLSENLTDNSGGTHRQLKSRLGQRCPKQLSLSFRRFLFRRHKSFVAIPAMDAVVRSRVIQDLIHFPHVISLAFRTDNLKHFPSPFSQNIGRAVPFVKNTNGISRNK